MKTKPKVLVIVGPTASGKTALSLELAKRFSSEVISADSRQTYRKLNIGTEKITPEEMEGVPHHLIDVSDIKNVYNAANFKDDAQKAIEAITARGNLPIIAGGTFFYIDTLLGKISSPEVPPNPELRAHLEDLSTHVLYTELERTDPERAFNVDKNNRRRIIRALEIVHELGTVPPQKVPTELPYDTYVIGIQTDKEALRKRLRERASQALTKGLVEETQDLLAEGVSPDRLSEIGLEYRVILEYIRGKLTDEELIQKLEEKNWQYAKQQLTWLKRDDSVHWFDRNDIETISAEVKNFLSN